MSSQQTTATTTNFEGASPLDSLLAALCPEERQRVENVLNVEDSSLR